MVRKIGIFDSGVGGLSVYREIVKALPQLETVYLADQLHLPYGKKSDSWLIRRSLKISNFFLKNDISVVVVACNSATTVAISALRRKTNLLYVGVEPALKPASKLTKTGEITVLATAKTLQSRRQRQLIKITDGVTVRMYAAPRFVKAVESGEIDSLSTRRMVKEFFTKHPLGRSDILVLGCTHYPFLTGAIRKAVGTEVKILNPARAVVKQLRAVLAEFPSVDLRVKPLHYFYTTGNSEVFASVAGNLIGGKISAEKVVI